MNVSRAFLCTFTLPLLSARLCRNNKLMENGQVNNCFLASEISGNNVRELHS